MHSLKHLHLLNLGLLNPGFENAVGSDQLASNHLIRISTVFYVDLESTVLIKITQLNWLEYRRQFAILINLARQGFI